MSATLKYDGPLPQAEVRGYGHFAPGDEKTVDDLTAAAFDCDPCKDEGWTVTRDGKKSSADTESATAAESPSPRGPRNHATHKE